MHELALVESVVENVCERIPTGRVVRVRLEIGRMLQALPDAMRFCFDVCTQGTRLEGAALDVIEVPIAGRCRSCGEELALDDAIPLCGCGSADLELRTGRELRILDVEVI